MTSTAPVIETTGLTKSYGQHRAIDHLDLRVDGGQIFGFLGPNGAGKTTTIRILLGLQQPSAGTARVFGMDAGRDSVSIHRRIGYLPGDLVLYPRLTGADHVGWLSRGRGRSTEQRVRNLSDRLDVDLSRRVGDLSKGNRQKVGLILAFMHDPELLVLDEPTSGLDPLVEEEFEELLREAVDTGRTVFLSSHQLDQVQRSAQRVAIIREGRLVLSDSVERMRKSLAQRIDLRLPAPIDSGRLLLNGVRLLSEDGSRLSLEVAGPIAPLLRRIAELDPVDLVVRHPDLDELFLSVYRENGHRPDGGGSH